MPSESPREIVISASEWLGDSSVTLTFLALDQGGYLAFLRSGGAGAPTCRIGSFSYPLTWRRAFRIARRYMPVHPSDVKVQGVTRWQEYLIPSLLTMRRRPGHFPHFLYHLPDAELEQLFRRYPSIFWYPPKVRPLARALRKCGFFRHSLRTVAALVGVSNPYDVKRLTAALKSMVMDVKTNTIKSDYNGEAPVCPPGHRKPKRSA